MIYKKILSKVWLYIKIYLYSMSQSFAALLWSLVAIHILFSYNIDIPLISLEIAFYTIFFGNYFYYIKKGNDRFTK